MDIKPNAAEARNAAMQFDLTKKVRESIQARQPLPPPPEAAADAAANASKDAAQVKEARDQYREQYKGRVANARRNHTANHIDERAAEVSQARADYRSKLEQRTEKANTDSQDSDRIEISDETKRLVEEAAARAKRDDESRAERVRELRELYRSGALDSEARVRRAAHKLLGGE
ncbi:MAG: flagellar biosynthesis anti-sigma factor FlgM [Planctomycetes bacterium]|nr:flagellar biosynthesis anti-sigma factor FlgM [Planctomycetota bacterium]